MSRKDENITNSLIDNENFQPKLPHLLRENLKFNSNWLNTYPWLCFEENKKLMYCKWCEDAKYTNIFVSGCDNFKEQTLKRHLDTKDHQKTLKTQSEAQLSIVTSFTKQLGLQIQLLTFVILLINIQNAEELHIPSNVNILKTLQHYKLYNYQEMIMVLIIIIMLEKILLMQLGNYKRKTLAIVSKHIISNIPVYRFVGLIELKDCSANGIMKELNKFFENKNLSVLSLGYLGSDSASVMLGHLNGIATQLKSQNPFLTEHHCISHHLAIAYEDAAEAVPYMHTYNKIVGNLYTYFSRSYERMETLKMVEKQLDDSDLHLLYSVVGTLSLDSNSEKSDHISILEIKIQITTVIQTITENFIETENSSPTWGYYLYTYLQTKNLTLEDILNFIQQFASATIENLNRRCLETIISKNPNFSTLYPNSHKIIELFLTLPLSNAVVE
ncbi:41392_t:CDS:2, partial [Gigaspora margarita]